MESVVETVESSPGKMAAGHKVWRWNKPLDVKNAREFHARALEVMKPGQGGAVVLDLSDAVYMDACGLQLLVALAVQCLTRGRLFEIAKASYAIRRDMELAGVAYLMRQE